MEKAINIVSDISELVLFIDRKLTDTDIKWDKNDIREDLAILQARIKNLERVIKNENK